MLKQPFIIFLVGLPCSGKSTFVDSFLTPWLAKQETYADILSSDDIISHVAAVSKTTFSSVYSNLVNDATNIIDSRLSLSSYMKLNIVYDQFNLTRKTRKQKLELLNYKTDYFKIAITFNENHDVISKRNENRTGRAVKSSLIKDLSNRFSPVIAEEGFDLILKPHEFIQSYMKE